MTKAYLNIVGMIILMVAAWFFIAPPMISAKDTAINLLGLIVLIAAPAITAAWAKLAFRGGKNVS